MKRSRKGRFFDVVPIFPSVVGVPIWLVILVLFCFIKAIILIKKQYTRNNFIKNNQFSSDKREKKSETSEDLKE